MALQASPRSNHTMLQMDTFRGPAGEYGARGTIVIDQDAAHVYDFMRQFEEQPKWNPVVKLSQITERVDQTTTHIKQVLGWSFLSFQVDFSVNLAMTEEPKKMQITAEMLQSNMMRQFSSKVDVHSLGTSKCQLEMSLLMKPKMRVPPGIKQVVKGQVRKQLHNVLTKAKDSLDSPASVSQTD